jgi:hypothetical protein
VTFKDPAKAHRLYHWSIEQPDLHQGRGVNGKYFKLKGRYYYAQAFEFAKSGTDADLSIIVFDVTGLPDTSKVKVDEPIQVSYQHLSDSSAASPYEGATTRLLFEPGGQVSIYVADDESGLGRHGTYTYVTASYAPHRVRRGHGRLDLDLDLNADQPTFPFQAFSTEEGTSTWQRQVLGVMDGTERVPGRRATTARSPSPRAGGGRARPTPTPGSTSTAACSTSRHPGPRRTRGRLEQVGLSAWSPPGKSTEAPKIVSTEKFANGVTLVYDDGARRRRAVQLEVRRRRLGDTLSLRPSPIASDPRVEVPTTKSPGDGSADPTNKTALLANPFATEFDETQIVADATKTLKDRGYTVTSVQNSDATFEGITAGLGAGTSGGTPGFVTLSTHGGANGSMATSEYLGVGYIIGPKIAGVIRWVAHRPATWGSPGVQLNGSPPAAVARAPPQRPEDVGLSPAYRRDQVRGRVVRHQLVFLSLPARAM